jgi:hypothetical protein
VAGALLSGLAHLGIEAEVGDELARVPEAPDVPHAGHEGRGRVQVHPGHRHQPPHLGGVDRGLGERAVDLRDLAVEEGDLPQAARDRVALVGRQLEPGEEAPSPLAREVIDVGAIEEVALQRGGGLVLGP